MEWEEEIDIEIGTEIEYTVSAPRCYVVKSTSTGKRTEEEKNVAPK